MPKPNVNRSIENFPIEADVRGSGFKNRMLLKDAVNQLLLYTQPLTSELVSLRNHTHRLTNRVLAQDISATQPIPAYPKALMDGYAIRSEDTKGATTKAPKKLLVIENRDSPGQISNIRSLNRNEAVKIPTGGVLPAASDAIIIVEEVIHDIDENGNPLIVVSNEIPPFMHVAQIGEDFHENFVVYKKGTRLREIDVGTLSALGIHYVQLYQIPNIAIFATGDEILDDENALPIPRSGQVFDANSYILSEYIQRFGWIANHYPVISDKKNLIISQLRASLKNNDAAIFTGGTAVGPKDLAALIIAEQGKLLVHGIHTKPASPTAAGLIDEKLVFALPGFPIASIIGFLYLALPILKKLAGISNFYNFLEIPALLGKSIKSKIGRREFLRVKLQQNQFNQLIAEPIAISGASFLSSMVFANGIVEISEEIEEIPAGGVVKVQIVTEWIKDLSY